MCSNSRRNELKLAAARKASANLRVDETISKRVRTDGAHAASDDNRTSGSDDRATLDQGSILVDTGLGRGAPVHPDTGIQRREPGQLMSIGQSSWSQSVSPHPPLTPTRCSPALHIVVGALSLEPSAVHHRPEKMQRVHCDSGSHTPTMSLSATLAQNRNMHSLDQVED